ncbi:response regulator [Paraburkholderia sp.]|uniref:response regulator n=1 Tax=Paraburkholderia sp. TaxID=1926495 RepID=UPI0023A33109|nr:response regulator [Paraburkholderia sp.]MDE1179036.1 response regulator [Paraburkholderia sp.]
MAAFSSNAQTRYQIWANRGAPTRPVAVPRVLVVDDHTESADALSAYLQASGLSVRTVYHGSDALKAAKEWEPDCIVLDVAMPGLSGIGVAAMLRQHDMTARIPLLAYTAYDTADQLRELKLAGFDAVCLKPADPSQLERLIGQMIGLDDAAGTDPATTATITAALKPDTGC